ncbi:transmembrane protein 26-like [Oncorhynchus kisutch]|uniref:transmembrane protein 26-like n=1 Tax=Oncorhynchus kisutch TaxID=8019 RepID=UPI0012DF5189|nr:transmembrane protein 26-like [Oncorhynchus kisutch]
MCRIINFLLALLSRFLFAVHGVVTVWRVVAVKGEPLYWLLLMGVALLGVEMAVTIKCTRNAEWKWFSPMVFLYLSTVIPSIWFLELSLLQYKLPVNISSGPELEELLAHIPISADILQLDPENWAAGLEQTMLIVLVLGRWLMPKGDMSRDQLSQLLMVYVGLGADILDIFDTFKEPEVKTNRAVIIMGLALFSWALMQFPLVLTQTSPPKAHLQPCLSQPGFPQEGSVAVVEGLPGAPPSCYTPCCSSEVWSLLLTVGLQDGPFLIYRLYLMIRENVLNQLMIFFTCKNILVVLLEFYRIFVVQCEQQGEGCLGGLEVEGRRQDSGEQNCQREEGREGPHLAFHLDGYLGDWDADGESRR